jgi:hypothetical protein
MMKTYISEKQLSMVGRAWEIRRYLKMAQRKLTKDTSLLTYLAEQTDYAHAQRYAPITEEVNNDAPQSNNHMKHPQPSQFLQNKQCQQTVPFPLWK